LIFTYLKGVITFKINEVSFGRLFSGVPQAKELDFGEVEKPSVYIKCAAIDTRLEILNYFE